MAFSEEFPLLAHTFLAAPPPLPFLYPWYAIRVRSNYERTLAHYLRANDYQEYVPLYRDRRQWSDRVREIEAPLFVGYVFCRIDIQRIYTILSAPGVVNIVGYGTKPEPILEAEMDAIRRVSASGLRFGPHPFMHEGQRVRVRRGPLKGLEGMLLKVKQEDRLVVSLELLQRSISTEIDRLDVEPAL